MDSDRWALKEFLCQQQQVQPHDLKQDVGIKTDQDEEEEFDMLWRFDFVDNMQETVQTSLRC